MKKNDHPWIRRTLICTAIFCLTATSFGAQPAQASPPASILTNLMVLLYPPSGGTICLNQAFEMIGKFMYQVYLTSSKEGEWARPSGSDTARLVQVDINAKSGQVDPKRLFINVTGYNKWESFSYKYKATKETKKETITVKVAMDRWVVEETTEFPVNRCKYSLHGTTDIGKVVSAMSPGNGWEFVGTYDIAGTVEPNEDGTLSGQGTADLFADAVFIGGGPSSCTCEHVGAWEGNSTVEIEADPNAWADEGLVDLQVNVESMPVNTTQVVCSCPSSGGFAYYPAFTIGSYDLDFEALPTSGGSTGLDFRFPNGGADFHMELIVSPEEAGS